MCRKLSDQTKQRISNALQGHQHSPETKQRISQSMRDYWQTIPYQIGSTENNSSINSAENGKQDTIQRR
jgi:hypothetical protein